MLSKSSTELGKLSDVQWLKQQEIFGLSFYCRVPEQMIVGYVM